MPIQVQSVKEHFASEKSRSIKMLVAGPPGSGKTRTASTWPNVLYADAEGRLLSIRDRDVRKVSITSMGDLEELKAALDQRPETRAEILGGPVDTVVIDTVDEVARIVIKERLRAERHETMQMADWGYLGDTMRNFVRGYRNLAVNVIFNVHLKSSTDEGTGRVEYRPAIQGAMGDQIAEFVDEAFLMVARPITDPISGDRKVSRHLQTYPDLQHDWVKDHSGALPQEFEINFDDDYQRLSSLIFGAPVQSNGAGPKVEAVPAEPTQPESVASVAGKRAAAKKTARGRSPVAPTVDVKLPEDDVKPADPEPTPSPQPEPEPELPPAAADEPAPEPEIRVVPEVGTKSEQADPLDELGRTFRCAVCGKAVEDRNYQDLSLIRFNQPLCKTHFIERNKR